MYRNIYDTDVTTWSPQGRIHQTEYAMEGVKLGTCAVGVRSNTHVVITGLKRSFSRLASYNSKIMKVDSHVGLTFSGITADAKYLTTFMRKECLGHRFVYNTPHPIGSLVSKIGSKSQLNTQRYSKRPYGCGLIIGGIDGSGPHLFETCPSGNFTEYYAIAFGSRSQAAKTYLERNFEQFLELDPHELIFHAVRALHASVSQDQELSIDNLSIGIVSKDEAWRELTQSELKVYLDRLATQNRSNDDAPGAEPAETQEPSAPVTVAG